MLLPNSSHVSQMNCIGEKPQEKTEEIQDKQFSNMGTVSKYSNL